MKNFQLRIEKEIKLKTQKSQFTLFIQWMIQKLNFIEAESDNIFVLHLSLIVY